VPVDGPLVERVDLRRLDRAVGGGDIAGDDLERRAPPRRRSRRRLRR
jgi:hypothetical protein